MKWDISHESPSNDGGDPHGWQDWFRFGVQIAAAGLIGFGIMFWVASHWDDISRFGRFSIVGGALAAALLVSLLNAARTPGLLVSFLATGGLFALIGQTYQTGADPWQLFAIWAAVGLPWALAARNDALYFLWTIVVMVAIALWVATFSGTLAWTLDRIPIFIGWLIALSISVLLSPHARLERWLGQTRWSFRMAALLTIFFIAQAGATDLVVAREFPSLYWLALLLLGGFATLLVLGSAFDMLLVSVLGLALDTLLITGFAWLMLRDGNHDFGTILMIGIAGAGLVAGTGAGILKLARKHAGGGPNLDVLRGREWPVILMTGIGALLTSLPLSIALSLLFGGVLMFGIGPYIIGISFIVGAVWAIRRHAQTSFWHQLAAIGLTLGFCLVVYGVVRDLDGSVEAICATLTVLAGTIALFVGRSWTAALLGAAAGVFAAVFINSLISHSILDFGNNGHVLHTWGWNIGLVVATACLLWKDQLTDQLRTTFSGVVGMEDAFSRFSGGAVAAGLLGTMAMAGPTFLLNGVIGSLGPQRELADEIVMTWRSLSLLSPLLALAGCALLLAPRPKLQTPLGFGAAAVVTLLSVAVPSLGSTIFVICAAMASGRSVMSVAGLIAALWVIGAFYYGLGWPLSQKAALMVAAGSALAALCLVTGVRRPSLLRGKGDSAPSLFARSLIIAGALAVGALAGQSIRANEATIANGREIYLALAPVDPRSLIQGDFMRLDFAVPQSAQQERSHSLLGTRRWAIVNIDDRKVATIDKVFDEPPQVSSDSQLVIPLRLKDRRWIVGTDAWFFREGTAEKWQSARFGIFRVAPDGTALLVGMADEDLKPIE